MDVFSVAKRSSVMSMVKSKDTSPEKLVRTILTRLGTVTDCTTKICRGNQILFSGRVKELFLFMAVSGMGMIANVEDEFQKPIGHTGLKKFQEIDGEMSNISWA